MIESISKADLPAAILASLPCWPHSAPLRALCEDFRLDHQQEVRTLLARGFPRIQIRGCQTPKGLGLGIHPDCWDQAQAEGWAYFKRLAKRVA